MRVLIGLLAAAVAAGVAMAQDDLQGRRISMEAAGHQSLNVPLTLPYEGALAEGAIVQVKQLDTGRMYPATVRNGEFVFVPEGAMPESPHVFEVEVREDAKPPKVQVTKREGEDAVDVLIDDVPFTAYHYSNENKKPFLWPVLGEGGVHVTRDYPMGEVQISEDHPHHKSMWSAYGEVNGADCWGEGGNSGFQASGEVTYGSGDAYGWVHAKNIWQNGEHQPVVDEEREYRFYPGPEDARIFDVTVTFTASYGDVLFNDTKEGGIMAVRVNDHMDVDHGGVITNSEGQVGEGEAWGQPAAWCDYSGAIGDAGVFGVTVFDHAENLRHPSRWHVRNYGLMGANCFGLSYFTKGKGDLDGDYTLKNGETLTFKYRTYVHSGDVTKAKVADRYADYATPPSVRWEE